MSEENSDPSIDEDTEQAVNLVMDNIMKALPRYSTPAEKEEYLHKCIISCKEFQERYLKAQQELNKLLQSHLQMGVYIADMFRKLTKMREDCLKEQNVQSK